jgi:hypothetical protein
VATIVSIMVARCEYGTLVSGGSNGSQIVSAGE